MRKKITVVGVVQGVGFRPFVCRLARRLGVCGSVKNTPEGVVIEAEAQSLSGFISALKTEAPPRARVDKISARPLPPAGGSGFKILKSRGSGAKTASLPPDMAICADCSAEISDKKNRRFRYAFTNCTNCGPRFTIVKALPYDRKLTAMSGFKLCRRCSAEFSSQQNRRFHAQPNACADCGPQVWLEENGKKIYGPKALETTAERLAQGEIAAIKSLGGFHLACDAGNETAVKKLRAKKNRPHKPFAVMAADLASVRRFCRVSKAEAEVLNSPQSPAVMLAKKSAGVLASAAPGLDSVGVMLAYTPLHKIIFSLLAKRNFKNPLVMTSGNSKDEPIASENGEAKEKLFRIADFFVFHDRPIENRCDDSVGFVSAGKFRPTRRARGFVPEAVRLPQSGPPVMGAGAHLKTTFCLTRGGEAFLSQHVGDMDRPETEEFYLSAFEKLKKLLNVKPEICAHDLHPDYATTRLAPRLAPQTIAVQHHLAHIASVIAENNLRGPVIGAALDGNGLGSDGKIWGCEFLLVDGANWQRLGTLRQTPLPGGDLASSEIWRTGLSWLKTAFGENWKKHSRFFSAVDKKALVTTEKMIKAGLNSPMTSSMGRLFDAVSFIAGIRSEAGYEGQAAMELEAVCPKTFSEKGYPVDFYDENGLLVCDPSPLIRAAAAEKSGAAAVSAKFHAAVVNLLREAISRISSRTGVKTVALSGGVFQNRILLERGRAALSREGFSVYENMSVPSNDGGLSLGQAYIASETR